MSMITQSQRATRMYRRMIKVARDWIVDVQLWRQNAMEIRHRFEINSGIKDPKVIEQLLQDGEKQLKKYTHPQPYIIPTGVDGTSWERDIPVDKHIIEHGFGDWERPVNANKDSHDEHHKPAAAHH